MDPAVKRFAEFLTFKTVSSREAEGHATHPEALLASHDFLKKTFPRVFDELAMETVETCWPFVVGSNLLGPAPLAQLVNGARTTLNSAILVHCLFPLEPVSESEPEPCASMKG